MGNQLSVSSIVDKLHALEPEARSTAFDILYEQVRDTECKEPCGLVECQAAQRNQTLFESQISRESRSSLKTTEPAITLSSAFYS